MCFKHEIVEIDHHPVLVVLFETQIGLMHTTMRLNEFAESPAFAGRFFTREEFLKAYKPVRSESYFTDWNGSNISGPQYAAFRGLFKDLDPEERVFCNVVDDVLPVTAILGMHREHENLMSVLQHELAHMAYAVNGDYRRVADTVTSQPCHQAFLRRLVEKEGYHESVAKDEAQAYLVAPSARVSPDTFASAPLLRMSLRRFCGVGPTLAREVLERFGVAA